MEAIEYYEEQRPGLGERFRAMLELTVQRIAAFPESGREIEGARRVLVPVFKYRVFYIFAKGQITMIGVYHPARSIQDLPKRI